MVSANALRDRGKFWRPQRKTFSGCDVALDSAGFVAMTRHGGYLWSAREYVSLASAPLWSWWAAMDYCCEPQIARNRDEVRRRMALTVRMLKGCQREAECAGVKPPMPVLQGWTAADYLTCFEDMD